MLRPTPTFFNAIRRRGNVESIFEVKREVENLREDIYCRKCLGHKEHQSKCVACDPNIAVLKLQELSRGDFENAPTYVVVTNHAQGTINNNSYGIVEYIMHFTEQMSLLNRPEGEDKFRFTLPAWPRKTQAPGEERVPVNEDCYVSFKCIRELVSTWGNMRSVSRAAAEFSFKALPYPFSKREPGGPLPGEIASLYVSLARRSEAGAMDLPTKNLRGNDRYELLDFVRVSPGDPEPNITLNQETTVTLYLQPVQCPDCWVLLIYEPNINTVTTYGDCISTKLLDPLTSAMRKKRPGASGMSPLDETKGLSGCFVSGGERSVNFEKWVSGYLVMVLAAEILQKGKGGYLNYLNNMQDADAVRSVIGAVAQAFVDVVPRCKQANHLAAQRITEARERPPPGAANQSLSRLGGVARGRVQGENLPLGTDVQLVEGLEELVRTLVEERLQKIADLRVREDQQEGAEPKYFQDLHEKVNILEVELSDELDKNRTSGSDKIKRLKSKVHALQDAVEAIHSRIDRISKRLGKLRRPDQDSSSESPSTPSSSSGNNKRNAVEETSRNAKRAKTAQLQGASSSDAGAAASSPGKERERVGIGQVECDSNGLPRGWALRVKDFEWRTRSDIKYKKYAKVNDGEIPELGRYAFKKSPVRYHVPILADEEAARKIFGKAIEVYHHFLGMKVDSSVSYKFLLRPNSVVTMVHVPMRKLQDLAKEFKVTPEVFKAYANMLHVTDRDRFKANDSLVVVPGQSVLKAIDGRAKEVLPGKDVGKFTVPGVIAKKVMGDVLLRFIVAVRVGEAWGLVIAIRPHGEEVWTLTVAHPEEVSPDDFNGIVDLVKKPCVKVNEELGKVSLGPRATSGLVAMHLAREVFLCGRNDYGELCKDIVNVKPETLAMLIDVTFAEATFEAEDMIDAYNAVARRDAAIEQSGTPPPTAESTEPGGSQQSSRTAVPGENMIDLMF